MIPLIDVMLVLLVIFIITAPLLTHSVKIDLPRATSTAQPHAARQHPARHQGRRRRSTGTARSWTRQALAQRMAAAGKLNPQPEVHIRADANAPLPDRRGGHGGGRAVRADENRIRLRSPRGSRQPDDAGAARGSDCRAAWAVPGALQRRLPPPPASRTRRGRRPDASCTCSTTSAWTIPRRGRRQGQERGRIQGDARIHRAGREPPQIAAAGSPAARAHRAGRGARAAGERQGACRRDRRGSRQAALGGDRRLRSTGRAEDPRRISPPARSSTNRCAPAATAPKARATVRPARSSIPRRPIFTTPSAWRSAAPTGSTTRSPWASPAPPWSPSSSSPTRSAGRSPSTSPAFRSTRRAQAGRSAVAGRQGQGSVSRSRQRRDAFRQRGEGEIRCDAVAVQAWLLAHPEALAAGKPGPIAFAQQTLRDAVAAYRKGDRARRAEARDHRLPRRLRARRGEPAQRGCAARARNRARDDGAARADPARRAGRRGRAAAREDIRAARPRAGQALRARACLPARPS